MAMMNSGDEHRVRALINQMRVAAAPHSNNGVVSHTSNIDALAENEQVIARDLVKKNIHQGFEDGLIDIDPETLELNPKRKTNRAAYFMGVVYEEVRKLRIEHGCDNPDPDTTQKIADAVLRDVLSAYKRKNILQNKSDQQGHGPSHG